MIRSNAQTGYCAGKATSDTERCNSMAGNSAAESIPMPPAELVLPVPADLDLDHEAAEDFFHAERDPYVLKVYGSRILAAATAGIVWWFMRSEDWWLAQWVATLCFIAAAGGLGLTVLRFVVLQNQIETQVDKAFTPEDSINLFWTGLLGGSGGDEGKVTSFALLLPHGRKEFHRDSGRFIEAWRHFLLPILSTAGDASGRLGWISRLLAHTSNLALVQSSIALVETSTDTGVRLLFDERRTLAEIGLRWYLVEGRPQAAEALPQHGIVPGIEAKYYDLMKGFSDTPEWYEQRFKTMLDAHDPQTVEQKSSSDCRTPCPASQSPSMPLACSYCADSPTTAPPLPCRRPAIICHEFAKT